MQPLVSILIPAWNHAQYVEQCLASIANQTYSNYEILFLDNDSKDDTYEVAERFITKHNLPAVLIKNTKPASIAANLNKLIAKAGGKYINFMSADDWMCEDNLLKKVDFLESHPTVGMVYSGGYFYMEPAGTTQLMSTSSFRRGFVYDDLLLKGNFVQSIGIMVRRKVFDKVGYYDEGIKIDDWDMWLRIAQEHEIDFIEEPLVYYRRHSSNFSYDVRAFVEAAIKIINKHKQHPKYDHILTNVIESYAIDTIDKKKLHRPSYVFFLLKKVIGEPLFRKAFSIHLSRKLFGKKSC